MKTSDLRPGESNLTTYLEDGNGIIHYRISVRALRSDGRWEFEFVVTWFRSAVDISGKRVGKDWRRTLHGATEAAFNVIEKHQKARKK